MRINKSFAFFLLVIGALMLSCKSKKIVQTFKSQLKEKPLKIDFDANLENIKSSREIIRKDGIIGQCLHLDKANNILVLPNQKIQYPYTVSSWFKGTGWLMSNHIKCSNSKTWGLDVDKFYISFLYIKKNKTHSIKIDHDINTEEWNHLVATFHSNRRIEIYLNGVSLKSIFLDTPLPYPNREFYLASSGCAINENNYAGAFEGDIDEFQVFPNALSSNQIRVMSTIESQSINELYRVAKKKNAIDFDMNDNGVLTWKVKGIEKLIDNFEILDRGKIIDKISFVPFRLAYKYVDLVKDKDRIYSLRTIAIDSTILFESQKINSIDYSSSKAPLQRELEGYGVQSTFGDNGKLYRVTTLNDHGPGSLRYGLENIKNPRTIIFEVSGVIDLEDHIYITHPFVSLYGQTAVGSGITLSNAGLVINSHDVLIQHLSIRPGDSPSSLIDATAHDGVMILGSTSKQKNNIKSFNIVIDHCSISWAKDENISIWYDGVKNVTISNCIISEALNKSDHPKGAHSKGLLVGPNSKNIAIIKNLFYNNVDRNPSIQGNTNALILNNIIYDCEVPIRLEDVNQSGRINSIIKYNLSCNPSQQNSKFRISPIKTSPTQKNNIIILDPRNPLSLIKQGPNQKIEKSFLDFHINSVFQAEASLLEYILNNVGANPKRRTATDKRILKTMKVKKDVTPVDCINCKNIISVQKKELRSINFGKHKVKIAPNEKFRIQLFEKNITNDKK